MFSNTCAMTLAQKSDRILAQTRGLSGATPNATQLIEELRWALEENRREVERLTTERDEARRMLCEDWAKQDGLPLDWQGRRGADGMAELSSGTASRRQAMTDPDIVDIVTLLRSPDRFEPHTCNAAADEIEQLRAERDEARRSVCSLFCTATNLWRIGKPVARPSDIAEYAKIQGWDCFKEASDER